MKNVVFVDGQNVFVSTRKDNWKISFSRFFVYLKMKYNVDRAYYFLGSKRSDDTSAKLYSKIEKAGFTLIFRMHDDLSLSEKKGNVDTDIVFEMLKTYIDSKDYNQMILVSGDGDYFKVVEYLISKGKFLKVLFPSSKSNSSLYKRLSSKFYSFLTEPDVMKKIRVLEAQNEKANLGN